MTAQSLIAILPCNDLNRSEAFYARLGFHPLRSHDDYRILRDRLGSELHLTSAVPGWLVPGRNPFGLYLRSPDAALAAQCEELLLHAPEVKAWRMYEFALSDPDDTLVRVGWPMQASGDL